MLRIDPTPDGQRPYAIPPDNPFVGMEGARPEIWAYGLRNPWRYSFDRATGDLWIGDVGQNSWEEVDCSRAPIRRAARTTAGTASRARTPTKEMRRPNAVPPVYEYPHGGCVVTGGYVYRGKAMPALDGAYVFADFCLGDLETLRPLEGGDDRARRARRARRTRRRRSARTPRGELYVLSLEGALYRLAPA